MKNLLLLFIVLSPILLQAQGFSADLFFEDIQGRRDTITVGYDVFATEDIDNQFGEVDILGEPRSNFDIRFFSFENDTSEDLPFTCDHDFFDLGVFYEDITTDESKLDFTASGCSNGGAIWTSSMFTIPFDAAFPITISWDKNLFIADKGCGAGISWISELSREEFLQDDFCSERINYDSISLTGLDSFVLEVPNFKTIAMRDSQLLSVYHIFLTDTGSLGRLVSTTDLKSSTVNIFPTPTSDWLYLENYDQNFEYQIFNIQGQKMKAGIYEAGINLQQFSPGIYFLQLSDDENLYKAIKFIKK